MNILTRKVPPHKKECSQKFITVIQKHKQIWIDSVVFYRDMISHYKTLQTKAISKSGTLRPPVDRLLITTSLDGTSFNKIMLQIYDGFIDFNKEIIDIIKPSNL